LDGNDVDAMSWFQVAVAREGVGDAPGAAGAYSEAIKLDPKYDLAWFNLGGTLWNAGQYDEARAVWKQAMRKFPEHRLTSRLRAELPGIAETAVVRGELGRTKPRGRTVTEKAVRKKTSRKKTSRKKTSRKKTSRKKTSRKKTSRKKTARKKTRKNTARKSTAA
jgi:tetratricopeptide (TPR) repeat protein